ncbi:hypothetical protein FRX31_027110 [Thalictrum thalictroides]|uniref:Uncharacterized protein n=1 Tax=Thalictrum thalictroides TaxID=46969 RepID=A0A7J6VEI1_THATH|nr:hypothetical protein FRX31_027110 [Thalictrum thalictroides]
MEFLDDIHQANYLEVVRGLSDPCPPIVDKAVNKIFRVMKKQFSVAIVFNGWDGFGKERILKLSM